MRISAISAACRGEAAARVSSIAFRSICQTSDSVFTDRRSANSRPRSTSTGESDASPAVSGTKRREVTRWVKSARSVSTTSGSAPKSYCPANSRSAAAPSPRIRSSNRVTMRARSASPSMSRTVPASTWPAPWAIAWSVSDSASRTEPSDARARSRSASSSASTCSAPSTRRRCAIIVEGSTRRRSKRWQRDRTVIGTFRISVVANTNFTCSGGSSSVFSRPLKACVDSMWTSSMM